MVDLARGERHAVEGACSKIAEENAFEKLRKSPMVSAREKRENFKWNS